MPLLLLMSLTHVLGCTPWREYVANGYKVGPNYRRPPAPVAAQWIDSSDSRIRAGEPDLRNWWTVFNDPVLNDLVTTAYRQNLSLRDAAFRILQARAQLGVAIGTLFPQTQTMNGDYQRFGAREIQQTAALLPNASTTNGITVSLWRGKSTSGGGFAA